MGRPEEEAETVAIILADPFEVSKPFGPLVAGNNTNADSDEQPSEAEPAVPWSLMRVCNVPLLAFALDSLQTAKIDKVFIYANAGFKKVQSFVYSTSSAYSFPITLKQTASVTEGDVLREADALELKSNFLLLRAGYLGNVDLARALKEFAVKRKADPNLVLDSLLVPSVGHSSAERRPTYAISPSTRLAHYQPPVAESSSSSASSSSKRVHIPREIIEEGLLHTGLEIRTDLTSVGVDVCSPEVCPLFSENFDWMNLRNHFIVGVLTSDLLGKSITCSIVGEHELSIPSAHSPRMVECASFTHDVASYLETNLDFLRRKYYPLSADEYVPHPAERSQSRGKMYLGRKVDMARTSSLAMSLVGSHSFLKANASVERSVLGNKCNVGQRSRVLNSILGHNCTIEDDCKVENCVVGDNVKIGKGTTLKDTLVGPTVVLGPSSSVQEGRVSAEQWHGEEEEENSSEEDDEDDDEEETSKEDEDEDDEESEESSQQSDTLGEGSKAFLWPESEDEEDSDSETEEVTEQLEKTHLDGNDAASSCSSLSISRTDSMDSLSSMDSDASINLDKPLDAPDTGAFTTELNQSIDRAFAEDHPVDNLVIELKTMRMSANVTISAVRDGFLSYLVSKVPEAPSSATLKDRWAHIGPLTERWGGVVSTLAPLEEADQVEVILSMQNLHSPDTGKDFPLWLRAMYEEDIITEEAVVEWWKHADARKDDDSRTVRDGAAAFVKALLEAESDSDEDSEDE